LRGYSLIDRRHLPLRRASARRKMRHSNSIRDVGDVDDDDDDDDDDGDDDAVLMTISVPAMACRRGISANMLMKTSSSTFNTNLFACIRNNGSTHYIYNPHTTIN